MKKTFNIFILSLFICALGNASESHRFWIAGKVLNNIFTNYDVVQYLERAVLDDSQRGKLFEMAEGNYDKYKSLVREHTASSFEPALRQLMYNKVLEHHATSGKKVSEWKAFKISPNDFHKKITELEDRVLKPLLDKRLGIVKSRDQFGAYLVENNFPHKKGESNTDVYFRWYNDQKFRLKHELRTTEAQKYEAIASMGHLREIYIRPTEQSDFYKSGKRKIEQDLNGKLMNQTEVSIYLSQNPDLRLLIKDVYYLGLSSAPLSRILEESQEKFESAKKQATEGLIPYLTQEKIQKIISYEALAYKMASKYKDAEKLREKSKQSTERFLQTGDYKDAMKARLYELAASAVDLDPKRSSIDNDLSTNLALGFEQLKSKLQLTETYTNEKTKRLLFEDLVAEELKKSFQENLKGDYSGYLAKVLNLGAWVLEFDAKKISLGSKTEVSVALNPYMTFEMQKKIQDHLKLNEFKRLMKDFKENKLQRDVVGLFSVDPNGNDQLYGLDAYDWLMAK